jgi:hypothetical protein
VKKFFRRFKENAIIVCGTIAITIFILAALALVLFAFACVLGFFASGQILYGFLSFLALLLLIILIMTSIED